MESAVNSCCYIIMRVSIAQQSTGVGLSATYAPYRRGVLQTLLHHYRQHTVHGTLFTRGGEVSEYDGGTCDFSFTHGSVSTYVSALTNCCTWQRTTTSCEKYGEGRPSMAWSHSSRMSSWTVITHVLRDVTTHATITIRMSPRA